MNIHCLQHVPYEGLGSIEAWIQGGSHGLCTTRLFCDEPLPAMEEFDLLVVLGGPMNIYEDSKYRWLIEEKRFIERVITAGKRVLGICLGAQLLADVLGARVYANTDKEIGWFPVEKTQFATGSRLFAAFPTRIEAFHWHADTFDIPAGALHVAHSPGCINQAFIYDEKVVGLQFHLETTPDTARALCIHGANELVEGRYIQTEPEMLSGTHRFESVNSALSELLDSLATANQDRHPLAGTDKL